MDTLAHSFQLSELTQNELSKLEIRAVLKNIRVVQVSKINQSKKNDKNSDQDDKNKKKQDPEKKEKAEQEKKKKQDQDKQNPVRPRAGVLRIQSTGSSWPRVAAYGGLNAFAALETSDARIDEEVTFYIGPSWQADQDLKDRVYGLNMGITIPFDNAALKIRTMPVLYYQLSQESKNLFGAEEDSGTLGGDTWFGAQFQMLKEKKDRWYNIDVSLELWMNPSTGNKTARQSADTLRFEANGLFGKTLWQAPSPDNLLQSFRMNGKLGFGNYQDGVESQNDYVSYGIAPEVALNTKTVIKADLFGYLGYRGGDKVVQGTITIQQQLTPNCSIGCSYGYGFTDESIGHSVFVFTEISLGKWFGKER